MPRGRKTKQQEVEEADMRRLKKYGIPAAAMAGLLFSGYKAEPYARKYFNKDPIRREVRVLLNNPDAVIRMVEGGNMDPVYLDAYEIIKKRNSGFGNVLAPTNIRGGNNQFAMNDPFSRIYVNDTPHTWGLAHDQASNLSGFPWYKEQLPTLAIKPSFGKKKRKVVKRKTVGKGKNWIKKAIDNPGALTAYAKRVAPRKAFTKRGTLRVAWLREVAKSDKSEKRRKQANLALRLKKMPKSESTKKRKKVKRKSKFGGKFNYTIQQYGNNASTPNLDQMSKISGISAYSYPITGPSAGNLGNLRWFDSKSNQAGMGMW